ncbi:MAG: S-methyl-5'-thioadenosine phosphorylase [Chloroflexota bacterium]
MTDSATIGIIGGSGLYAMESLEDVREVSPQTPFGEPSDAIVLGSFGGQRLAFLPRHGRGHRLLPTEVPVRANIYALKALGVQRVISVSAVGSMREELTPLDLVVPDQVFDRTKSRVNTFFGDGVVAHVGFAEPFCADLSAALAATAERLGVRTHRGGTYLCIEGPQFSTKAESRIYRQWGVDVIGMTVLPEAKLAREAELCYATLAFVTDYDVWHSSAEAVTVEMVVKNLAANVGKATRILQAVVPDLADAPACRCGSALQDAIMTAPERISPDTRRRLGLLLDRYLPLP